MTGWPITLEGANSEKIAADMSSLGYGVIENAVPPDTLMQLRAFVESAVQAAGGEYVAFSGADQVKGSLFWDIGKSPEFMALCKDIYERGVGKTFGTHEFYQVLRCLSGATGDRHGYYFHYDSYVITALIPVIIPEGDKTGDLIMFPNSRPTWKYYARNLVGKILLETALSQKVLKYLTVRNMIKPLKVKLKPGNIYFFWGCRTLHANEPCDHSAIRSTALFHIVDPYETSSLRKRLGRA